MLFEPNRRFLGQNIVDNIVSTFLQFLCPVSVTCPPPPYFSVFFSFLISLFESLPLSLSLLAPPSSSFRAYLRRAIAISLTQVEFHERPLYQFYQTEVPYYRVVNEYSDKIRMYSQPIILWPQQTTKLSSRPSQLLCADWDTHTPPRTKSNDSVVSAWKTRSTHEMSDFMATALN